MFINLSTCSLKRAARRATRAGLERAGDRRKDGSFMTPNQDYTPKEAKRQSTNAADEALIIDTGSERRYFSSIPHLVDDLGLSPYAVRLYLRIKRRAGEAPHGKCFESTKSLAAGCKMSGAQVSRAKKELASSGLITISTEPSRHGEYPRHVIRIVDIWSLNIQHCQQLKNGAAVSQGNGQSSEPFLPETDRFSQKQDRFSGEIKEEPKKEKPTSLPANASESAPSLPSDRQSFESKEPEQAREGLSGEEGPKPAGDPETGDPSPDRRKKRQPSERELKRDQLQAHFLGKVGVPPPPTTNEAAAKKANKLWWTPLREILDWVDWDADRAASLVSWAVDEMRDAGLTISNPNSILEKARALMGEMNRGAQPGVIKVPAAEMGGGVFLAPDGDGFYC